MHTATRSEPAAAPRRQRLISWRLRIFVAALLALEVFGNGTPTLGKLERELGRIDFPSGTRIVDSERNGNPICFDVCTTLDRHYRMPGKVSETRFATILRRSGYEVFMGEADESNSAYSKRFEIGWSVGPSGEGAGTDAWLSIAYGSGG